MVYKYSFSETKVGYSAQATSPKIWWEMPKFLRVQTRSSDAEISWIACRHIPHPLILVAFVSVISYFQLPACSADPNEPRSRGNSVARSSQRPFILPRRNFSLQLGNGKGENFLSAVGKLFFSGFISLAWRAFRSNK